MTEDPGPPVLKYEGEAPVSVAVVRAIAAVEDVDPTALPTKYDQVLFDRIDPEQLDRLAGDGTGTPGPVIEFSIYGYRVRVEDATRVLVYERAE